MTPLYRQAQEWLLPVLGDADGLVIDGTCGNGNDTLFLCRAVKDSRLVLGIDIQEKAVAITRNKLEAAGFSPKLVVMDHADLSSLLAESPQPFVSAAIFNLGYLPGGDHRIITKGPSTIKGIASIIDQASKTFRLAVVAYQGHQGGREETVKTRSFLAELSRFGFSFSEVESESGADGPVLFRLRRDL